MASHFNNEYSLNNITQPNTSFRSSGAPLYGNQPSNVSYDNIGRIPNRIPIPPPRTQNYSYSSYSNPYSSGYNSLGRYSHNYNRPVYNGYSPYYQQSYGNPMIGQSSPFEGSFIEEAHESSREAFASIESIVNAFGSINMMIESTYCALQSSFNAVLSVVENFSRLKSQFGQVLSTFTLIRTIQWLYKKLLYLIGLRAADPASESAWKSAARSLEDPMNTNDKKSSWPVIMFFIAVYAGPFLMWKFINSIMQRGKPKDSWLKENGDFYYAIAKYSYEAQAPEELSFTSGEYLRLAPYEKQANKSWPLASNGKRTGFVPINYIDIKLRSAQSPNIQESVAKVPNSFPPTKNMTSESNLNGVTTNLRPEDIQPNDKNSMHTLPLVHETSNKAKTVDTEVSASNVINQNKDSEIAHTESEIDR